MKKPSRNSLRNKADKLFSQLIRSQGYCEAEEWQDGVECGGPLQCAHIVGRANYRLRWTPDNAFCLCAGHHVWYTNHPLEWFRMVEYRYPSRMEYLIVAGREPWDKDYDRVISFLTALLEGE